MLSDILVSEGVAQEQANKMQDFAELIKNAGFNLTRILDDEDMAYRHFLDSIAASELIPEGANAIDIGTGAGFPGVPLLIVRPDIKMTFVESAGKKADFVKSSLVKLGLSGEVLCKRAEELSHLRESFDMALSRAAAPIDVLLEIALPLVKVGGSLLLYAGDGQAEAAGDGYEEKFGAKLVKKEEAGIKGLNHFILKYDKIKKTPKEFPRKYAQIVKKRA